MAHASGKIAGSSDSALYSEAQEHPINLGETLGDSLIDMAGGLTALIFIRSRKGAKAQR